MATSITALVNLLKDDTSWQRTPEIVTDAQYESMVVQAIKRLYIDTGRASEYNPDWLVVEEVENEDGEMEEQLMLNVDLKIDEELYILLLAKISFFKRVQSDVNNIVGYTTDALTVTNADKPYAHLQDTIADLDKERRIVYYKMVRYCLGVS